MLYEILRVELVQVPEPKEDDPRSLHCLDLLSGTRLTYKNRTRSFLFKRTRSILPSPRHKDMPGGNFRPTEPVIVMVQVNQQSTRGRRRSGW